MLLPSVRSNIATGVTLGMGRIIGDTAIVRAAARRDAAHGTAGLGRPVVGLLRGTGSTLTSYVYDNSPAGEGAAPQKAYAAAFVLLVFVLGAEPARRPHRPLAGRRDRHDGRRRGRLSARHERALQVPRNRYR